MLILIKSRIHEHQIQELLAYSVFPDPDHLEQTIQDYITNEKLELFGYESDDVIVGILGFQQEDRDELTIQHIAVRPDSRGAGFGRGLILEAIAMFKPERVLVETDEEAVNFYRSIGFEINSLGEKYPGVERFVCSYYTDSEID
ncbi:GNAT family N-acetyltransferase [Paenibacillus sp. GP183]|uniref:GNAT family N-acetyltransferase n=1 Tax=Paenibacillus sp. GP183 TaxID=1882751 RepID=UPI000B89C84B|nr:GNAT family N-acetyltransferase [Paenibacillus sp. GP183]